MAVSKQILGLNARNFLYQKKGNKKRAKNVADDKLLTKELMLECDIPTIELLASFRDFNEAREYAWEELPRQFVLKPAHGYGGEGIVIVRKWDGEKGVVSGNLEVTKYDLESHVFDILDGAYSLNNLPDRAFIEAKIVPNAMFKKLSPDGIPDIRVVVWNSVPIMAMLRLPTAQSEGKANVHQGALAIGIDLRTGITTQGTLHNRLVEFIPDSKTKVRGIKIPHWETILKIATKSQTVTGLGYAGIDLVLDEERGPLVLEINARPGLAIQLANGASLRTRMERIADMKIPSVAFGIDLAKRLFAESSLSEVEGESNILEVIEKVVLIGPNGKKTLEAKVDTGAYRTSLDTALVEQLGFEEINRKIEISAGVGVQKRRAARITFRLRRHNITTIATHIDRSHMRYQMIIGRRDLHGFLVNPTLERSSGVK